MLQNGANEQNRYLLALCYYETRQLLNAKTILLMGTDALESGPIVCQKDLAVKIPNGAAGLYLLGGISKQDQCHDHAIEYFRLWYVLKYHYASTSGHVFIHLSIACKQILIFG